LVIIRIHERPEIPKKTYGKEENLKYLDMTGWYCNKVSGDLFSKLPLLETLIASDVHLGDGLKNNSEAAFLLQNNCFILSIVCISSSLKYVIELKDKSSISSCISLENDGKVDNVLCDRFNSVNAAHFNACVHL
jgi:hypothetical protein